MASSHAGGPAEVVRLRVLLPGLYVWAATVLSVVADPGAPLESRAAAALAVIALVLGAALLPTRHALGRALALHLFIGACLGTWLTAGRLLGVDRLDPLRAALGSIGWAIFALAWGTPRVVASIPEDDPHALPGAPLRSRGNLPRGAALILAVAVAGASLASLFAWRVTRPHHALLAHAVATLVAIHLVTSGAELAVRRGRWKPVTPAARRLARATVPLLAVAVLLLVGLASLLAT